MTESDATPGDLAGTVREVQHALRERYGATEVDVDADDITEWGRPSPGTDEDEDTVSSRGRSLEFADGDLELVSRSGSLTITLQWVRNDIPYEEDRPRVTTAAKFLARKAEAVLADYPEADVSTYTDGTRAQLTLDLGEP